MGADDLAPPGVSPQPIDQPRGAFARRKQKGDRPRPDATGAEGILGGFRVVWPVKPLGDSEIVPARRVSVVSVGAPLHEALVALGGGYFKVSLANGRLYGWNHAGLSLIEMDGKIVAARATRAHPEDKFNISGGAVAMGHPIGCSGTRIMVTLLHNLKRLGKKRGMGTICLGGGNATTMIVEME